MGWCGEPKECPLPLPSHAQTLPVLPSPILCGHFASQTWQFVIESLLCSFSEAGERLHLLGWLETS